MMDALAVVFEQPNRLALQELVLIAPTTEDIVVDVEWTGISSGTERLLYTGRMPAFPGMGYPLVPGYESVGRVVQAGNHHAKREGERVFIAGARCYADARALFGGAASRLIVPAAKAIPVHESLGESASLLALAATAHHAVQGGAAPDLVVGHGVLGRLIARVAIALGHAAPTVWEREAIRQSGARGYEVTTAESDIRADYRAIYDVSGSNDPTLLDTLIGRLGRGGELVLAGFYDQVAFRFTPAFHREARLRIAAEFTPADLRAVTTLANAGTLDLHDLITHRRPAHAAADAYGVAFDDAACVKMVLDWREPA